MVPIYNRLPAHMKDSGPRQITKHIECPLCGSPMRRRQRQKDNKPFYGCTNWSPDGKGCHGTRNAEDVDSALDSGEVIRITRLDDRGVPIYIKEKRGTMPVSSGSPSPYPPSPNPVFNSGPGDAAPLADKQEVLDGVFPRGETTSETANAEPLVRDKNAKQLPEIPKKKGFRFKMSL